VFDLLEGSDDVHVIADAERKSSARLFDQQRLQRGGGSIFDDGPVGGLYMHHNHPNFKTISKQPWNHMKPPNEFNDDFK
jgi:hypothetical protein